MEIGDVRSFVKDWNLKYPVDRWWREKYNVPFGSPQHLDFSFLDMRIAFEEAQVFAQLELNHLHEKEEAVIYRAGRGEWLRPQAKFKSLTENDVDDAFDKLVNNIDNIRNLPMERGENGKVKIRI